jgi:proteasome lid subunit RPN8/RPN11
MENFTKLKEDMNNHALSHYPREAVGIITKDFLYIPCKNLSNNPNITFFLDPAALVQYDGNIWGIFHSHPGSDNPIPSSEDKVSAAFNEYKFLVGFNNKFFIYWYDSNIDALKFDMFKEVHLVNNS